MAHLFLRLKSLNIKTMQGVTSNKSVVRVAATHNLRENPSELGAGASGRIDPMRVGLNYVLRGPDTASEVAALALALMSNAGVCKLRKDQSMAVELIFSLPPQSNVDHHEFFEASVMWADGFFKVPILSAVVHLDESAPHCHVLLLPLVDGRMKGGEVCGGPPKIKLMSADFHRQVGQRFGLMHRARTKRLSAGYRTAAGGMILQAIITNPLRLSEPPIVDALIAALGQHHETLLSLFGLAQPVPKKAKGKTFVQIFTAAVKPERNDTFGELRRSRASATCIDVGQDMVAQEGGASDNMYVSVQVAAAADAVTLTSRSATCGIANTGQGEETAFPNTHEPNFVHEAATSKGGASVADESPVQAMQGFDAENFERSPAAAVLMGREGQSTLVIQPAPNLRSSTSWSEAEAACEPKSFHATGSGQFVRESVNKRAELWNPDVGEWMQEPLAKSSRRAAAAQDVGRMLAARKNAPIAVPGQSAWIPICFTEL